MDRFNSNESVIPISYGSTEVIETGKWGFQKPETAFMTAPCQEACPAGNPIAQFLYLASEKKIKEALEVLLKENPFPGVCGRVCFHPCEIDCNRGQYDQSVSIQGMERFVSEAGADRVDIGASSNGNSKRIAVVGAGPAGLSAAYFLRVLGHEVTLFEAKEELGGVMRSMIPGYRLPKTTLDKEIERILRLCIDVRTGVRVGKDLPFEELDRFDAIFLSPGAERSPSMGIEGEDSKKVWRGRDFLERVNSGSKMRIGKEIIVVGGGNTAMDVARSALRLGSWVTVAYRRTKAEMPAIRDEVREAQEEGVRFEFLIQPAKVTVLKERKRIRVKFQRMRLRGMDQNNRRRVIPIQGDFATLEADRLITAVGEGVDLSWIPEEIVERGLIKAGSSIGAGWKKIFAGGDAVDQPRTIVTAIAAGKKGAISIDLHLRGLDAVEVLPRIRVGNRGSLSLETYLQGREERDWPEVKDVVLYDRINTLFFEPSQRIEMAKLPRKTALKGFTEVNSGFSSEEARLSALRCFSCGTCNYCYNCYFFCPEGVISLDPLHQTKTVDLDHCKGCGTCAKSCPRNVVMMKEAG